MSSLKVDVEAGKKITGKFLATNEKEVLLNKNLEDLNDLAEMVVALEAAQNKKKWEENEIGLFDAERPLNFLKEICTFISIYNELDS